MLEDFPVPASPNRQTVVRPSPLYERLRVIDQLLLCDLISDKVFQIDMRGYS